MGSAFSELAAFKPEDLSRTVTIRGEGLTVLQAIARQMTHYAYHVGQVIFLCGIVHAIALQL